MIGPTESTARAPMVPKLLWRRMVNLPEALGEFMSQEAAATSSGSTAAVLRKLVEFYAANAEDLRPVLFPRKEETASLRAVIGEIVRAELERGAR